jgi:thymidine phosphorylase
MASMQSGAGRTVKDGPIDLAAGVELLKKAGEAAEAGEALATVQGNDPDKVKRAARTAETAFEIGDGRPAPRALVLAAVE